jgi:hypothetical protein
MQWIFGDGFGEWKRRNPLLFSLLVIFPAAFWLFLMSPGLEMAGWALGIWLTVAVVIIYLPLKLRDWISTRRRR